MVQNYNRLVNVFVRPDLRDEIRLLKRKKTYDEFLRNLIKKHKFEDLSLASNLRKSQTHKAGEFPIP